MRDNYLANRTSAAPQRLSLSQFDPATGEIEWPSGLQTAEFEKFRKKLDGLFTLRARTASTSVIARDILSVGDSRRGELKRHIDKMSTDEYLASRKFVDSLVYVANSANG